MDANTRKDISSDMLESNESSENGTKESLTYEKWGRVCYVSKKKTVYVKTFSHWISTSIEAKLLDMHKLGLAYKFLACLMSHTIIAGLFKHTHANQCGWSL